MRGFLLGAIILVGLDLVLKSPSSRTAEALAVPTAWLAEWMDPRTPLISASASASSASSSTSGNGSAPPPSSGGPNPITGLFGDVGSGFLHSMGL